MSRAIARIVDATWAERIVSAASVGPLAEIRPREVSR
jgi:hypothetical protein